MSAGGILSPSGLLSPATSNHFPGWAQTGTNTAKIPKTVAALGTDFFPFARSLGSSVKIESSDRRLKLVPVFVDDLSINDRHSDERISEPHRIDFENIIRQNHKIRQLSPFDRSLLSPTKFSIC
jgi:hypothetical protein